MDYATAVERVMGLADMERGRGAAAPYDLGRMRALLERLGEPQLRLPTVHVGGTKGKGSVAAMAASVLTASGRRTGLYTSPHLHTVRERLRVDGRPIDEATFAGLVERVWGGVEAVHQDGSVGRVTTFEVLTAMAFVGFVELGCEAVVLEVGLGGRLDATNVVPRPLVSILTSISLDHTQILGDTLAAIAADKAAILKAGCAGVISPQPAEALGPIRARADAVGSRLVEVEAAYRWSLESFDLAGQSFRADGLHGSFWGWIPLLGRHQLENAVCVLAACEAMRERGMALAEAAVREGLRAVCWPGRLEVLSRAPLIVVDGAHNGYSAAGLRQAVEEYFPVGRRLLVVGMSADKDALAIAGELAPLGPIVFACASRHPRSLAPAGVAAAFREAGLECREYGGVADATRAAVGLAGPGDLVLGTGSLFTVAEVREEVLGIRGEVYPGLEPRRTVG